MADTPTADANLPAAAPAPGDAPEPAAQPAQGQAPGGQPVDPDAPVDAMPDEAIPHPGFWQQKWVQDFLPFGTSLAVHVGIVVVGLLLIKPVTRLITRDVSKDQIVIPDATIADNEQPGGIPNPGLGGDQNRQAAQDQDPTAGADNKGWSDKKSNALSSSLSAANGEQSDTITSGRGGIGTVSGTGSLLSGSDAAGGGQATFGTPGGGGGLGPPSKIFGKPGGNVRSIVYICDASGSMMTKMDTLKQELVKSASNLKPIQAFDVVFFREPTPEQARPYYTLSDSMLMANADNKKKLHDFLDGITPHGATFCIPSLEYAFKLNPRPQLIYLLTDGEFEDEGSAKVMEAINRLNPDHKVHINTILLTGSRKEMDDYKDVRAAMQKLADENGGNMLAISLDDL